MNKPLCTATNPAPPTERENALGYKYKAWNNDWEHPDAVGKCINDCHNDWEYYCPHCKQNIIYEGPDY